MTTFCEAVTARDRLANPRRARLATKELGEAMAPASEPSPQGADPSDAGAAPVFSVIWRAAFAIGVALSCALAGCGDDVETVTAAIAAPERTTADPARVPTELDGAAPVFGQAELAELTGDLAAARAGFARVVDAADAPPLLAARAALHLAQLEARAGSRRRALDLVARAQSLAPGDAAIAEGVNELRVDVIATAGDGDLRGPALGTQLPGVPPAVAAAFATAERALARVRRMHPRPVIESLSSSIRDKEAATEDAVARYRAVAEQGGLAGVAASYRAGSLYHDLALGLLLEIEMPPEMNPVGAAGFRRTLRGSAIGYLKKAVAEYRAALAVAKQSDDELWRLAAETDLRGASGVLGGAGAN